MTDLNQNQENLNPEILNPEALNSEVLNPEILSPEILSVEIPAAKAAPQDTLTSDLEKAKLETQARIDRLREIGKTAAAAAFTEIKAGSKELGTIAKNRLSTVATSFSSSNSSSHSSFGTSTSEPISEPISEPTGNSATPMTRLDAARLSDMIANWLRNLRVTLGLLDTKLDERYGDRYQAAKQTAKQRFDETADWYNVTLEKAKANPDDPTLVEQKQTELAAQAEVAGSIAAKKEQQLKQQIKQFLQTAVFKS
ncbi:hypothetical protein [Leptolyngbya ohadii]|uniref:hypothetical protein n=1 Tax=Leptolyngbya ohadii TaxID=1962290 RepID=UPI000B5A16EB|nr:hypothetical protein [Leptolyngbya ohadii]